MRKCRTSAGPVFVSARTLRGRITKLFFIGVTMTGDGSHLGSQVLTGETILDTSSSHRGFVEADFTRRSLRSRRRAWFRHRIFVFARKVARDEKMCV